jgi:hypothetical protein
VGAGGAAETSRRTGGVGGVDLQPADPGLSRSSFFLRYISSSMVCSRSIVVSFARFTVTGCAGNSNRTTADAAVELILLRLGVRWTVDPAAGLADVFQDHGIPPG